MCNIRWADIYIILLTILLDGPGENVMVWPMTLLAMVLIKRKGIGEGQETEEREGTGK